MIAMQYLVLIEEGDTGFGAYVPDLPGCIAVGETRSETLELIREAIAVHIEGLCEHGDAVPEPHATVERIAV